jgi:hypothetical protein
MVLTNCRLMKQERKVTGYVYSTGSNSDCGDASVSLPFCGITQNRHTPKI